MTITSIKDKIFTEKYFREAAIRPAGGSLIAEMFPSKQRGIANGIFSWGVYLGYGFSFLFGIYLTQLDVAGYGWRSTYVLAALPGFCLCLTLLLVREPRAPVPASPPVASLPGPVRKMSYGCLEDKQSDSRTCLAERPNATSYTRLVLSSLTTPAIILLFFAAAVRHTGRDRLSGPSTVALPVTSRLWCQK